MARLYRDGLRLLRLIERCGILRHCVHTGHEVIQLQLAVLVRRYGFIEIIASDCEGNSGNLAVLGGLFELQVSIRHGEQQKTLHRVIHRFGIRHQILKPVANAELAVRPRDNAASDRIFLFCRQRDRLLWRIFHRENQMVAHNRTLHVWIVCCKRVILQNLIGVEQLGRVAAAVPLQRDRPRLAKAFRTEGWHLCVLLHI